MHKKSYKCKEMKDVALLIKKAQGKRSLRQYAKDTGVYYSNISKIINKRLFPSPATIYALTVKDKDPQSRITYEQVMNTAGYPLKERPDSLVNNINMCVTYMLLEKGLNIFQLDLTEPIECTYGKIKEVISDFDIEEPIQHFEQLSQRIQNFETVSSGVIAKRLAEKGILFREKASPYKQCTKDWFIEIVQDSIIYWRFIFWYQDKPIIHENLLNMQATLKLGEVLMNETTGDKISIIVNQKQAYEYLCKYKDKLAYQMPLSVIYIDPTTLYLEEQEITNDTIHFTLLDEGNNRE